MVGQAPTGRPRGDLVQSIHSPRPSCEGMRAA
jgi:hypothetical protein